MKGVELSLSNQSIFMAFLEKVKDTLLYIHDKLGLEKRTIFRKNDEPYLTRYYLFRKPVNWMPSLYLHCFHASDEDPELHSHPWNNSLSLILAGGYREELFDSEGKVYSRRVMAGSFNLVKANKFHRVDLLTPQVWTLFLSGSKKQSWGFKNRVTLEYTDWQEHERRKLENQINSSLMNEVPPYNPNLLKIRGA